MPSETCVPMTETSNGVVILITLLNILVYKLQKLQEAQQKKSLPLSVPRLCRRFSIQDIKLATNNFSEELVIGKGGFGIVYKGIIDFGERVVAIKRSKSMSKQRSREFLSEIEMLSKFQHSHIVSLIGYCDDGEEMILVYDYMPSGSLADHLHKRVRKGDASLPSLTWVQRLKICIGAAHGLDYLHTGTGIDNRVIHRDVKTSNILLDEKFAAKISDFGLSKTGPANQTCTYVSTRVRGTHGYLDPYYVATDRVTSKSDVYAFGVVLFEALCGRPAVDPSLDEEQISLAGWAQHCSQEGLLEQIIDPNFKVDISSDSLNTFVDIAVKCLHTQPKLRPTMAEVVVALQSALALQEKSTYYCLEEIIPDDYSQEDLDPPIIDVKDTIHNREHVYTGEKIVKRRSKQTSARMTFTRRFSALISVATRAFSVNKYAKTSRYTNGVLSGNSNKPQAARPKKILVDSVNDSGSPENWIKDDVFRPDSVNDSVSPKTWKKEELFQPSKLKSFDFIDLRVATRNFHFGSVLGEGGFGRVYKGWIDENTFAPSKWGTGMVVAVKRLNLDGSQGHQEWLAEINYLGTLTHPNLVKLLGYCLKEEHRLLVYEFASQGSLENHLFRRNSDFEPLSWNLRIRIALGAAKGLAYLHSSLAGVIYRDFKTSNILIDSVCGTICLSRFIVNFFPQRVIFWPYKFSLTDSQNYNAKLSDFGIAKDGPDYGSTHVSTMVMGTYGYAAPEYVATGHLTYKSDIYGFGVVLLEILSGRRAIDKSRPPRESNLVDWAKPYLTNKHKVSHVMDTDIKGQYTVRAALKASSLALQCLSVVTKSRPDANQVVKELEQLQDL